MKIAIITEGGLEMGMGHIVRSITLAKELRYRVEICFFTNSDEIVVNEIKNAGFHTLNQPNSNDILSYLKELNTDIVIIDKLNVEENFAKEIKNTLNAKLIIFGNLSDANNYADIVVNAVIGTKLQNRKFIDNDSNTLYFCGPRYYVLRKEFYEFKKKGKRPIGKIEKILLILGGSDPSNLTSKLLTELLSFSDNFKIDVVLGSHFVYFNELNQILNNCQGSNEKVKIYRNIKNVAELMYKADLVITSPGVSLFEALCVGTSVVTVYQNEVQKSWFGGAIPILEKNEINKLKDIISNGAFLKPDTKYIKDLTVGQGKAELLESIIRGG